MLEKDNSQSLVDAAVNEVKRSVTLDESSQSPQYSGHESADYGSGPDQSSAVPSGSPGTGGSDDSDY